MGRFETLLVTGGAGVIGSNFVRFVQEKYKIIVVDALKYGSNLNNLKDLNIKFIEGNICDYKLMTELIKGVDAIVNFAAESHVDRSISGPYPFIESNIVGTHTILEAMRKVKPDVKLVHISTDEVYGETTEGSFTENDPLRPSSPYSASKASSDMLVLSYVRTYDLDVIITRCTNNFGPYQFPEKLIPKAIIRANMNKKIPIYGTGENIRDWIYVLDHCKAIETVLNKGEKGEIYNISSGEERTNLEVAKEILSLMGKDNLIEFVEDRPGHDVRYALDSSKIRKLGWRPKYSFKQALEKTISWYLNNKWWWEPLATEKILHPTPWKLRW